MKKSIAIDMDDTIADTLQRHISWYKNEFGIVLSREEVRGKKIYDVVAPEHLDRVRSFPHDPNFFRDLEVIENAVDVIRDLSRSYEIYFATAAMEYPSSFNAKYEWLRKHFPFINDRYYIFCGFKGMLNCDYLIDDSSRHIAAFKGKGFLFTAESNVNEKGFNRINSWLEAKEVLG